MRKSIFTLAIAGLCAGVVNAYADSHAGGHDVIRHKLPNSDFPISLAVEIPASKALVHLSGQVPAVINDKADAGTTAAYGSMEEQATSVLQAIEKALKSLDLTMGDIYRMQVFLVAQDGKVDFSGFMDGYTKFFGTEAQPNLPVRSAVEVAALANPGWLIEIEVSAVRQ
ncbi:RidA family protein [uncultured Marinobacter sp.]|uniref:RidA family protein n=1 Tax=uncultured Marinobacter sp. TaxID=187379 RepID=UPI002639C5B7|nr:RidA family protein [uncultured Marinobacter sp.]